MNIHYKPRFVVLLTLGALLASCSWAADTVTCNASFTQCSVPENSLVQLPFSEFAGDVIVQESGSTTVRDVFRIFNNVLDTGGGTGFGNLAILYSRNNLPLPASFSANASVIKEAASGSTTYSGNITTYFLNTMVIPAVRVPEDFPTIQLAVNSAHPGDTIRVGPGRWCGAWIRKPLNLVGEGATIMGCPPASGGPVGSLYRIGFYVTHGASGNSIVGSGTSISGFVFDGAGFSDANLSPLAYGILSQDADDLVVDSNTFLGGGFGVLTQRGNRVQLTHNVFNGFTVLLSNGFGGAAILASGRPITGNVIQFNTITAAVPPGDYSSVSWVYQPDVPLAGIVLAGQDGAIISNNKSTITSNAHGDAGVGILVTDLFGITNTDLDITNNDGRGSQYGLIVTNDQGGGTGNSVGLTLRGNLGVNLINNSTFNVKNRSINTVLQCDPTTGLCP